MIPALARFVDALRAEGVAVSSPEAVDAARALGLLGLERRETVRRALAATLAKDRTARAAFDRLFDRFFAPVRLPADGKGKGQPAGAKAGEKRKRRPEPPETSRHRSPSERESEKKARPGLRLRERRPKIVRAPKRSAIQPLTGMQTARLRM